MFAIDEMAYKSPLRGWPPAGKLFLTLALLFGSLFAPTPAVPLLVLVIGVVLLHRSCGLHLPDLIAFACLETFFMLLISVKVRTTPSITFSRVRYGRIRSKYQISPWVWTSFSSGMSELRTDCASSIRSS